jgi:hypothetical protein
VKLTKEISKLKAQERKHQWYKRRKLERSTSQSTDEGFSSQQSLYQDGNEFSVYESSSSQEDDILSHCQNDNNNISTIHCSRESDVRASSISNYDR